jgi:hypothetical protein
MYSITKFTEHIGQTDRSVLLPSGIMTDSIGDSEGEEASSTVQLFEQMHVWNIANLGNERAVGAIGESSILSIHLIHSVIHVCTRCLLTRCVSLPSTRRRSVHSPNSALSIYPLCGCPRSGLSCIAPTSRLCYCRIDSHSVSHAFSTISPSLHVSFGRNHSTAYGTETSAHTSQRPTCFHRFPWPWGFLRGGVWLLEIVR